MLGNKKVFPNLLPGKPSGSQRLEFLVKLPPVDVNIIPEVFRLHLAAFSFEGHQHKEGLVRHAG